MAKKKNEVVEENNVMNEVDLTNEQVTETVDVVEEVTETVEDMIEDVVEEVTETVEETNDIVSDVSIIELNARFVKYLKSGKEYVKSITRYEQKQLQSGDLTSL